MAKPPPSFNDLQSSLKSALLNTTRTTSALCAEDLPFQRSLDPDLSRSLDRQNARLLSLAERLLASAVAGGSEVVSTKSTSSRASFATTVPAPKLEDGDALDRNWSSVVDVVDSLLERTDGVLDEVRGVIKKGAAGNANATASEVGLSSMRREQGAWELGEC
jgi:exosome complex exonuclease RRP6